MLEDNSRWEHDKFDMIKVLAATSSCFNEVCVSAFTMFRWLCLHTDGPSSRLGHLTSLKDKH